MQNLIAAIIISSIFTLNTKIAEESPEVLGIQDANQTAELNTSTSQRPTVTPPVFYDDDPNCKTPYLQPADVAHRINTTKTMDLNFVALADAESGLNNQSRHGVYRGIFHMHSGFHKIDDYCSPEQQVQWLESKLKGGANPQNLFPSAHHLLYK